MARSEWSFGSAAWLFHRAPLLGRESACSRSESFIPGGAEGGGTANRGRGGSRKPTPGAKKRSKHPEEKKE